MSTASWGDFDKNDLVQAMKYGEIRTGESKKRRDNWGLRNDDPITDSRRQTVGTLGEWAVAEYFQQPYVFTVNTFKAPDVVVNGYGIQVKASEYARALIIRPDAKDHEPYVLARVRMPEGDPRDWEETLASDATGTVELLGWMFPYEARLLADSEPSLIRDPNNRRAPAIFIRPEWLHLMPLLDDWIDGRPVIRSVPKEFRQ